jgi:hypothetical protein
MNKIKSMFAMAAAAFGAGPVMPLSPEAVKVLKGNPMHQVIGVGRPQFHGLQPKRYFGHKQSNWKRDMTTGRKIVFEHHRPTVDGGW